jgi:monovalent cation/hydrogen antiporter
VTGLLVLAPIVRVPYPILMVLGGLALAVIPGVGTLELKPEVVLVAFLPPLLYSAAFFTSLRDFRANLRPISLLAIGLVVVTSIAVAAVAHAVIGLPWAAAFVLGAVVSPTDPIAATAIARRLGVTRRLVNILEGESLVNDATALIVYRAAVAAVLTGSFSLWKTGLEFVGNAAAGIAIGLAVAWIIRQLRRRLNNPPVELTISLVSGYLAYLPAEAAGVSAVLAAVTAGIYLGWYAPELTTAQTRLQGQAVWEILVFVLNAALFVLIGLQLPVVVEGLEDEPSTLAWYALAIAGTVILVRLAWMFPAAWLPRRLFRRIREHDPMPSWQQLVLVGWTGMRGAVSLAAALAIPLTTDAGQPFPGRDLILFLTFATILATLVLQGLSLPAVIRALELGSDGLEHKEETKARIHAADAALRRLDELTSEDWVRDDTAERLRGFYGFRRNRFAVRFDETDDGALEQRSMNYQRLRRELLEAEREAVVELRQLGRISDDVMRRIERDIDLEYTRLDV